MKEGDIILTPMPQADGKVKNRPAIYLREMPPFRLAEEFQKFEERRAIPFRAHARITSQFDEERQCSLKRAHSVILSGAAKRRSRRRILRLHSVPLRTLCVT